MTLEAEVQQALRDAGEQLKKDLWRPEDLTLLAGRAKDLVGLNVKAASATDPAKKKQYKLAAEMVIEHVKLLALIRMQVTQQHVLDALGKFFMNVVVPALGKLLISLF